MNYILCLLLTKIVKLKFVCQEMLIMVMMWIGQCQNVNYFCFHCKTQCICLVDCLVLLKWKKTTIATTTTGWYINNKQFFLLLLLFINSYYYYLSMTRNIFFLFHFKFLQYFEWLEKKTNYHRQFIAINKDDDYNCTHTHTPQMLYG